MQSVCHRVIALLAFHLIGGAAVAQSARPVDHAQLGRAIAREAVARDGAALFDRVNVDAFAARAFGHREADSIQRSRPGVAKFAAALLSQAVRSNADGVSVEYVGEKVADGERRITCRLVAKSRLDYVQFIIEPAAAPPALAWIADVYVASTGELMSETMRRSLISFATTRNAGDPTERQRAEAIGAFRVAATSGDPRDALRLFASLDQRSRSEKHTQFHRLIAASRIRDERAPLDDAATDFRHHFPGEPACDLILLHVLGGRGDTKGALASVDRVEEYVGGDPYLDSVRARICLAAGDTAGVRQFITRRAIREPHVMASAIDALRLALRDGDYAEAKRWMLAIERTPSFAFRFADDFDQNTRYAGFRRSPQFAEWQRERPAATRPTR